VLSGFGKAALDACNSLEKGFGDVVGVDFVGLSHYWGLWRGNVAV